MASPRNTLGLLIVGLGLAWAPRAAADTFSWGANPWPGTSDFNEVFALTGGETLSVNILNGAALSGGASPPSPETNIFLDPPSNGGSPSLFVRATGNGTGPGITFEFLFSHPVGVTDLSFRIYDIDSDGGGQWIDLLDVTATALGGGTINPTAVNGLGGVGSTVSWTPGTSLITGLSPNQGNNDEDGTAEVQFATPITGFQIVYRNGENPGGNQWVAISDLTFTPVPEPGRIALLVLAALALARRLTRTPAID